MNNSDDKNTSFEEKDKNSARQTLKINSMTYSPQDIITQHYSKPLPEHNEDNSFTVSSFFVGMFTWILDSAQVIIIALAIFVVSYLFVVSPHTIDGPSMQPNFCHGDVLLADKLSPRFNGYQVGDVIVFKHDQYDDYIKRIVGVGGDKVKIEGGKVYRNGQLVQEPYLPAERTTTLRLNSTAMVEGKEYIVPVNQYFVLGDNRDNSNDSRSFLFIDPNINTIKGKVLVIMWPIQRVRIFNDNQVQPEGECLVN